MSKREEFKKALSSYATRDKILKAYDKIHPPEFKPGDYVTCVLYKEIIIGVIKSINDNLIRTTRDSLWRIEYVSHSTPEEISVYNKRIKDEV